MTPTNLTMPPGFPDATLHDIKAHVILKMKTPSQELDNLLGAENGIRFRLRACSDYSDEFTDSVQKFGDTPASSRG